MVRPKLPPVGLVIPRLAWGFAVAAGRCSGYFKVSGIGRLVQLSPKAVRYLRRIAELREPAAAFTLGAPVLQLRSECAHLARGREQAACHALAQRDRIAGPRLRHQRDPLRDRRPVGLAPGRHHREHHLQALHRSEDAADGT